MCKKIFLDDKRTVDMSHNHDKGLGVISDFITIRTDIEFIQFIDDNLDISLISFDHDLGIMNSEFSNGSEFTGKTACEIMIERCLDNDHKFPDWYVHSDNTCGRDNIIGLILNYMRNVDGIDTSEFKYYHKGFVNGKFV